MSVVRINKRQQALLSCIDLCESRVELDNLSNFVFMATQNLVDSPLSYTFNYLNDAPVSFQLNNDIRLLERSEFIGINKGKVALKAEARRSIIDQRLEIDIPSVNFLKSVKLLKLRMRDSKEKNLSKYRFYTVGYEGMSIDETLSLLIRHNVSHLIDVRKNPISRAFGYSKSKMIQILSKLSIDYIHLPELGIDSAMRKNLQTKADYKRLFKYYRKSVIPQAKMFIDFSIDIANNHRTCFLCYEALPEYCHRDSLGKYILANTRLDMYDLRSL